MFGPPSTIQAKTYVLHRGTWRKAKKAFFDWAESEGTVTASDIAIYTPQLEPDTPIAASRSREADSREVRPALRVKVFLRDRFRCVFCGTSPATNLNVHNLHADHIKSVAEGGKTVFENLQTLCPDCNLGKGSHSTERLGTNSGQARGP